MDVGVATSLSRVVGLSGDGVGDNDGDCDGREGGRGGNACSTLGLGVDKAVTGVGVEGETEDRCEGISGNEGNGCGIGCGRAGN